MTATQNVAVEQIAPDGDSEMCDVCGHTLSLHDRVAERYCEATLHNALSRLGLRRADHRLPVHVRNSAAHPHQVMVEIDVLAAQLGQLPEPQPAPRGQQHHRPIGRAHLGGYDLKLGQRRRARLPGPLTGASAPHPARV
jgi:hypothetical protein